MNESVSTDDSGLSANGKIAEVMRIVEELDYPELLRLHDLIDGEYKAKVEAAREAVIAETHRKFDELGLSFEDVVKSRRKRKRSVRAPAQPKYRSPEGKTWSGRGRTPKWVRELEEQGWKRVDYLINTDGES